MEIKTTQDITIDYVKEDINEGDVDTTRKKWVCLKDLLNQLISARESELHNDWNNNSCFNLVEKLIFELEEKKGDD